MHIRSRIEENCEDDHFCRENAGSDTGDSGNVVLSIVDVLAMYQTINNQKQQIKELEQKLNEVQNAFKRSLFRLENIRDNDELIKTYTGFPEYVTLLAFYDEVLKSDAEVMRQWEVRRVKIHMMR